MTQSTASSNPSGEIETRIIESAYICFDRYGIAKTTMEDIARGAKVSRQTVYRFFSSKDDILDTLCCHEAVKINQLVRKGIQRDANFATTLTDALFIIITEGNKNAILRQIVEVPSFQTLAASAQSRSHQLNLTYWKDMMERAAMRGELAGDLSLEEIVGWLIMMQTVLQFRLADETLEEDKLYRIINRFIVAPLLPSDRFL
ncbi:MULTISPECIES: TetR/AcrR family transcriptional regulator [unclassified Novosphingobium]|uniref:TetR/AcrR family transcriptional regulator n=1 Tax=unclassified Novosphingobium TaxID=2644732 RepID=UPI000D4EF9C8|nr:MULTISPECIES: TetR/AcrR family transcriptional regulator [unclassified Novosphingobium]PTR12588.1 TetR family transcriptional regulator [Novosphingobium sp. GV055]PUB06372.1 TetR family transcriptional regulator [Novosphingobium sp. GV061]PUB22423.1 TetR family transcriptional regulator [Novosphingobium sp. GV079]PUB44448.1 TetR family transcriptional regulator [Novosphingobium sp. GV027]